MNYSIEQKLQDLILERYSTMLEFSRQTGVPRSTLSSILKRGILNSTVSNVKLICQALSLNMDDLTDGRITSDVDASKPVAGNIDKSLSDFCRDLRARDDLYMNGRPLDHEGAVALAELIELSVGFVQKRQ